MTSTLQALIVATNTSHQVSVLQKICGQALIRYQTALFDALQIPTIVLVNDDDHALMQTITEQGLCTTQIATRATLHDKMHDTITADQVIIVPGNIPLINKEIITNLCAQHRESSVTITLVCTHGSDTVGRYDRIVQHDQNATIIPAHESALSVEACCLNVGMCMVNKSVMHNYLLHKQHEAFDDEWSRCLINTTAYHNEVIATVTAPFDAVRSVTTFEELWAVEQIQRAALIRHWMEQGVRFYAPQTVHIDHRVTIGAGSSIGAGVHLLGTTEIGKNCTIKPFSLIEESTIANDVLVDAHSVIQQSTIGTQSKIGPFAYVHTNSSVADAATVGNFVEVTRSSLGSQTKVRHLTYLGDAQVGTSVNIGAGTITANYDGVSKHTTTISHNASIGANNTIVAPVTVGTSAYTAAGSTITKNVPENALAIARSHQTTKEGYAPKLRQKAQKRAEPKNIEPAQEANSADEGDHFIGALKMHTITMIDE